VFSFETNSWMAQVAQQFSCGITGKADQPQEHLIRRLAKAEAASGNQGIWPKLMLVCWKGL
jgi:hypothetical protein